MKKRYIFLPVLAAFFSMTLQAQEETQAPKWYVGVNGGIHVSYPDFSGIDTKFYPSTTNHTNGVGGIFVQGEFGKKLQFAIRPEIMFTTRSGGLENIGSNEIDYKNEGIDNVFYRVSANYLDFRVPLIYNFGNSGSALRPYVYIAPILGISYGGKIRLQEDYDTYEYSGYQVDLNKSNYNNLYFAGAAGVGARYSFPLGFSKGFVGLEVMYEYGFTDTYGSKEKDGAAININPMFPEKARVEGSRKFRGLEVKLSLGVPFDAFKKKTTPEVMYVPAAPVVTEPVVEEVVEEEKPCYSLDEIVEMMAQGKNVYGKTICAIDDDINFDFGKADIKPSSYDYLNRLAETLQRTNAHIVVKGHTDNVGAEDVNLTLSKNRAINVANYLKNHGVSASKLTTEYYGMSRPIYPNDTEEGRAKNRRVEFEIINN